VAPARLRIELLRLVISTTLVSLCWSPSPLLADVDRPNVLLILVDDLGYGDLASYGATDLRTPNIDELLADGMRFDEFYANCPVCSPTRASLLTGRYPELVGVPGVIRTHTDNSWGYLAAEATLLPEMLDRAGYETALVGKWHLGLTIPNRPNDRGFAFFHGFLGDMMDDYYHHRRHNINYMRWNLDTISPEGHASDLFSDWSCDYIREQAASENPFFLYLAYNAPHTPIQPPADWLDRIRQRTPRIDEKRAKLVALIEHLDAGIGRVLAALDESGQRDDTLVIFTSDNGGQLSVGANNGSLRDGKQSMYEGGLKVPFGAAWHGRIEPNSRSSQVAATMDLFPTLCGVAGVEIDHRIDGQSILPTLLGQDQPAGRRDLFFHRREGGQRYGGLVINAVKQGDWKLLQNSPFAALELYDLANDPSESNDLADTNRGKFAELAKALRVQVQRGGAVPWQPPSRRD
jgi:arylsulfatase A-like enzyme